MEKRAEMISGTAVMVILAIVGLAILLGWLYLAFGQGDDVSKEACRLSVLTRATTTDYLQAKVPLNCQTEKICVTTKRNGRCEEFVGEDSHRIIVDDGENIKEDIEGILANSMYDCWSITGEGRLDLFGKFGEQFLGSTGEATCVICSRVAFAEDIPVDILKEVDVNNYLETKKVPTKDVSYFSAFTNGQADSISEVNVDIDLDESEQFDAGSNQRQIAILFSQVKAKSWESVLTNDLLVAVGVGATTKMVPFGGKIAGGALKLVGGPVVGLVAIAGAGTLVGLNAERGRAAAATYCGDFVTSAGEDEGYGGGCSVVQILPYSAKGINGLCPTIQGSP